MSNTLLTPDIIAKESLRLLINNLVMAKNIHTEFKKEWEGKKVGNSVDIRRPVRFYAADGATAVEQEVNEESVSLTVDSHKHVCFGFSQKDLTLSIEQYSKRYLEPAMEALANKVDSDLCKLYDLCPNLVGTPGSTPDSIKDYTDTAKRMSSLSVPVGNRRMVLGPEAYWDLVGNSDLKNFYDPKLARDLARKGYLGNLVNFDTYQDQNIASHTVGTYLGSAPLVNQGTPVAQEAESIDADEFVVGDVLKKGDIITFDGCYAVNPMSQEKQSFLRQFVVTADCTADGSGEITIPIYPKIITPAHATKEAYATCDSLPADDAPITVVTGNSGAVHPQNLAFHRNAIALACIPIELSDAAGWSARATHKNVSIAVVKDFDFDNYNERVRLDIMYAKKLIYPELLCRLTG